MRTPVSFLAVVPVTVLLLSGCTPADPSVTPGPAPSSTPAFASDEEALAAATKAYGEYLAMSDQILHDGGANPERIRAVARGDVAENEIASSRNFLSRGLHSVGTTTVDHVQLQAYDDSAFGGTDLVTVYLCVDVSGVDVLDVNGDSVVSPDRPSRTGFEVGFDFDRKSSSSLVVASRNVWDGSDLCV